MDKLRRSKNWGWRDAQTDRCRAEEPDGYEIINSGLEE